MIYHIVVGDIAGNALIEAVKLEPTLEGEVIVLKDILHVGPLKKGEGQSFSELRSAYWQEVSPNSKEPIQVDDMERLLDVSKAMYDDEHAAAWLWMAPWPADVCAYHWMLPYLFFMNRAHNTQQADYAIKAAQDAGFTNLTIDLIYGTPGLSDEEINMDDAGGVSGILKLQKGELRKIDSVHIDENVGVSKGYLERYLDIFEGSNYSEKKLGNISARLRELPFLQESAPWQVAFKLTDTRLKLFLKPKRANQLNAIIGLIPNNVQTGKFLVTADATLALQNILSYGESIAVTYQNLQYRSPKVNADLVWPYLLNSPIGIDAHFSLFKRDTTFSRTSLQAGLRYQVNATDYIRLFYQDMRNHLIAVDTAYIKQYKRLPDNADVSADGAGLELVINRTDYRLNPRKGWQLRLSTSALLRRVQRSDAVTALTDLSGFDYAKLYDSLEQQRYQYHAEGSLAGYLPLGKKTVLMCAYNGAWVSGRHLFQNELYQVGGFKLLRGFDEQSVYANQYHILTLEMRLLLDRNSYFYLFSDNGYVQGYYNGFGREGIYDGFGMGTTLETKTGIFTISYALGRSDTQALQFKQSKIHFGYLAYF